MKIGKLNKFYGFTTKIQKLEQFQKTFSNSKIVKKVKSWQNSILKLKASINITNRIKMLILQQKSENFNNFKKLSSLEKVCV